MAKVNVTVHTFMFHKHILLLVPNVEDEDYNVLLSELFVFCRWLFPFIGHMGIGTSTGVIRDFAGPYFVSVST